MPAPSRVGTLLACSARSRAGHPLVRPRIANVLRAERAVRPPPRTATAVPRQIRSCQVRSLTGADGALVLTDAMPFSIALAEEYISLRPIVWPLAAVSTK